MPRGLKKKKIRDLRLYPVFTGESVCCLGNILELFLPPYSYSFLTYLALLWCLPIGVQVSNKSQTAVLLSTWSPRLCKEQL